MLAAGSLVFSFAFYVLVSKTSLENVNSCKKQPMYQVSCDSDFTKVSKILTVIKVVFIL